MEKTQYFENAKNNDILSYVYMENEKVLAKKIRELELIGCNIFSCSIINTELKSSNVDGTIIIFIVDVIFIIRDLKQNYLHIIFLGDLMNLILLD